MASQHSNAKTVLAVRLPNALVAEVRAHCVRTGEPQNVLVERVLRAAITPPPPDGQD